MTFRSIAKRIWSVLSIPFWIIVGVNIETYVVGRKWNTFLTDFLGGPESPLVNLATTPILAVAAGGIVGFTIGVWTDNLLKREEQRRPTLETKLRALSKDCDYVIRLIENGEMSVDLAAEMDSLIVKLKKQGITTPAFRQYNPTVRLMNGFRQYLLSFRALLRDGHLREAREAAKINLSVLEDLLSKERIDDA